MANTKHVEYVEDCGGIKPLPMIRRKDGGKKTKATETKKSSTKKKK